MIAGAARTPLAGPRALSSVTNPSQESPLTSIAYRNGVLASDSLVTSNGMREGQAQKIHQVGPLLIAGAGASALCDQFVTWVRAGMKGDSPWQGHDCGNSMIVMPDDTILIYGEHGPWKSETDFYALGSGEQIALGAMAFGASAEQAIECAIRFDVFSGGPIRTLKRAG